MKNFGLKSIKINWPDRIPGKVLVCSRGGELQILLFPGSEMTNGGAPIDIPTVRVSPELRIPNICVGIRFDESNQVQDVGQRTVNHLRLETGAT